MLLYIFELVDVVINFGMLICFLKFSLVDFFLFFSFCLIDYLTLLDKDSDCLDAGAQ